MVYKGHRQITTKPVPYKKSTYMCQKAIYPCWLSLIKVFLIKHTGCIFAHSLVRSTSEKARSGADPDNGGTETESETAASDLEN